MISKSNPIFEDLFSAVGDSILIDKPLRWSSFKVIYFLRKNSVIKKAGHAGTLDPLATGLLIVCSAKKTKEIISYQDQAKQYTGTFMLGKSTPSMDAESEVSEEKSYDHVTNEMIYEMVNQFSGEITQLPPMFSAVSHHGKKLYKLARKGKVVERTPRHVKIDKFEITDIALPYVKFKIDCSKGVYIRSIANDFGEALGCGAYLTELRRTKIGEYSVDDAFTPDELLNSYFPKNTQPVS